MESLSLEFSIVPDHPRDLTEPVVALGNDFEAKHPGAIVYKSEASSILSALWVDLIAGRPLAPRLVLRKVPDVEYLFCLALFMDRELALHPKVPTLVGSVELAKHFQVAGLAHIEPDLARLLIFLDTYLFEKPPAPKELSRKLQQALLWIRDYSLEDKLPNMPRACDPPKILDHGTNGFVVAESRGRFLESIIGVYRLGFLRGVLFGEERDGHSSVLCFKKSPWLSFDLNEASVRLNVAEEKAGQPKNWVLDGLHLHSAATKMPRPLITEILLRV